MAQRIRPTLTVTLDPDIREALRRLQQEKAVNISRYLNQILRQRFPKKLKP